MRFRTAALLSLLAPAAASGSAVQGSIQIPVGFQAEVDTTPSLWLLENGVVPIAPPLEDPRTQMVVVLDGGQAATLPPANFAAALRDMRVDPRVIAVVTGSSVEFKNEDRAVHALYAPGDDRIPAQPQASGSSRTIKFTAPGVYQIRCKEVPHVRGAVLVLPSGRFAVPKAGGAFKMEDVPPGSYTLRVWYGSGYVHSQPLEVRGDSVSVEVQVAGLKARAKEN